MSIAGDPRLFDVDRLADACAEHTARFFSRMAHNTAYCFELFRRAIVGCNSYAWEKIYQQYHSLVASWARHHNEITEMEEEVDYFVNCAFDRMWSALTPDKFRQFQDLAALLRYLQTCVHSVIIDHVRSNHLQTVDLDKCTHLSSQDVPSIEKIVSDELERYRLWKTVVGLMRNEKEVIVLKYSFLYELKPSQIYADNPDRFESLDEVYRIKRNLLNRLGRNPALKQFLG